MKLPDFIYGTAWKEETTEELVFQAIEAGFRAIDTANQRKHYFEEGVGTGLLKAYDKELLSREDLFLQTKFTFLAGQDNRLPYDANASYQDQVIQSFESSLAHLHTDYVDSYILHGPSNSGEPLASADFEVWEAMEEICESGRTKAIGISNVNSDQLIALYEKAKIKPSFVQNRCYSRINWDKDVRAFCKAKSINYQGFSLLTANKEARAHPDFQKLVRELDKTEAHIMFRFAQQSGMIPLTGTTNPENMRHDLACNGFDLKASELQTIEGI